MSLTSLGWNSYFAACWEEFQGFRWLAARVVSQQRGLWRVAGDFAEGWAAASGKLREEADGLEKTPVQGRRVGYPGGGLWPTVGDWVAVEILDGSERAIVHGVLPRRSQFGRKAAGRRVEEQVIVANVDVAFVVAGLGSDFNLRRLERYLAQCWESGAKAVIVLNKVDECDDPAGRLSEVERVAMGVPVFALSALTGQGMDALEPFLLRGQTVVLLGSSGVGKSTLLNRWLGHGAQAVRAVREGDGRGRHTTTSRELFALPGGALVIDTPGLRELQLWDAAEGVAQTFADIDALAQRCRFRDCGHTSEPECAVQAAIGAGELDPQRLENRRKLEREQEFLRRKIDPEARKEEKERVKVLFRGVRQMYERRKRDGGKE